MFDCRAYMCTRLPYQQEPGTGSEKELGLAMVPHAARRWQKIGSCRLELFSSENCSKGAASPANHPSDPSTHAGVWTLSDPGASESPMLLLMV